MTRPSEFQTGDFIWIVYSDIAVKCKILDVDDHFVKQHPDAYYFYWVDEPVGHGLPADELLVERKDAEAELLRLWHELEEEDDLFSTEEERQEHQNITLDIWRELGADFIIKTHEHGGYTHPGWPENFMPPKTAGEDWFNVAMLLKKS